MVGNILHKRYKIVSQLGTAKNSGFAATYLARDTDLPDAPQCVVKRIEIDRVSPGFLQLLKPFFQSELRVLAALGKHEQMPLLLNFFAENRGFYLVREFIDGSDLSNEIGLGKRWQEAEVIEFLKNILQVLQFARDRQAIHGNINLQNLIRRHSDGAIVLTDFGEISRFDRLREREPSSMETFGDLSATDTDIYNLGTICIHALTGIQPELLKKSSDREIVWRDRVQVSSQLAEAIDKMVHRDRRQCFASIAEVQRVLKSLKSPAERTFDILEALLENPSPTNRRSPAILSEREEERTTKKQEAVSEIGKPDSVTAKKFATDSPVFAWESLVGLGIALVAAGVLLSLPTSINKAKKGTPSPSTTTPPLPKTTPTTSIPTPAIAPSVPIPPALSVPPLQSKPVPSLSTAAKPPQLASPPPVIPKKSLTPNISKLPKPAPAIVALPPSAPITKVPIATTLPQSQETSVALSLPKVFEVPLISTANVNFTQLRALLAAKNWGAADRETKNVMLSAAGRVQEGVMDAESVAKFPCTDMQTIDRLWAAASSDRFGFKAQQRIWQNLGGINAIGLERTFKFGDAVGWRTNSSWKNPSDLTFALQAPLGHLPIGSLSASGWRISSIGEFFARTKACGL